MCLPHPAGQTEWLQPLDHFLSGSLLPNNFLLYVKELGREGEREREGERARESGSSL